MTPDEKNKAHKLLFEQRENLVSVYRTAVDPDVSATAECLIAICDILELQIRRVDELEHL
jgi:hypothetical protein